MYINIEKLNKNRAFQARSVQNKRIIKVQNKSSTNRKLLFQHRTHWGSFATQGRINFCSSKVIIKR